MKKNSQLILELVTASCDHPTAEQLFLLARERSPKIALSTVYNNLGWLVEQGLVRKISLANSPDRYDRNTRHDHLICVGCGKVTDLMREDLTAQLSAETGEEVVGYELNVRYFCSDCREK